MLYRIEAVISTASNNEEYVGKHLGLLLLGRPLTRMVVTFEEEMTETEVDLIRDEIERKEYADALKLTLRSDHAITVHSVRISRNFQH